MFNIKHCLNRNLNNRLNKRNFLSVADDKRDLI